MSFISHLTHVIFDFVTRQVSSNVVERNAIPPLLVSTSGRTLTKNN